MEPMKVSFGFSKLSKKTNIVSSNFKQEEKKLELVECLEGHSIKIKDPVEEVKQPLIIPLKDNEKNLLDRIRAAKRQTGQPELKNDNLEDTRHDSELNPEELAVRQLINEAKLRLANGNTENSSKVSVLPINEDAPSLEGKKEPTLEDYESVPVSDYGFALLRGMGWKDGMSIGKNSSKSATLNIPELRPKGLGLGATKVVESEMPTKKSLDKDGNELVLARNGFAKVIAGPQKGNYCEIQGFDEEAGRVIIKVYPKGEIVNINELMLTPVTKEEFSKGSKIINNAKYEEYKEISDKKLEKFKVKQEASNSKQIKIEIKSPDTDSDSENEKERWSKGKSHNKTRTHSSSKNRHHGDSSVSHSPSDDEEYVKKERKNEEKEDSEYRNRSRSKLKSTSKNEKVEQNSSDKDYYEKDKKNKKHSKSKTRDRSRSKSKKNKKHSSRHRRNSSESDVDYKKDKRKRNKCKSRHRKSNSDSSEDRRYRSKK